MIHHVVTAADDAVLNDYRRLNDQAYRRRYEGDELFMVEGFVAIDRLLESGHEVRSVLLTPSRVERFADQLAILAERKVPVYVAERSIVTDVVGFDLHRGVIGTAERRPAPTLGVVAQTARRLAVLEGLNDAENLGAIARAARALGIDALVIDPTCTDPYSRRSVRVSMGEILLLPVVMVERNDWPNLAETLAASGIETWAMTPAVDAESIWTLDPPARVAVLLGAEGDGLAERTIASAARRVRIPVRPGVDSLNVAQASAVTFAALDRR
jgi:tRNA G18 (ribose-2'-O)-methylase SpoU